MLHPGGMHLRLIAVSTGPRPLASARQGVLRRRLRRIVAVTIHEGIEAWHRDTCRVPAAVFADDRDRETPGPGCRCCDN